MFTVDRQFPLKFLIIIKNPPKLTDFMSKSMDFEVGHFVQSKHQ